MESMASYLDELKEKKGFKSDADLGKFLGVSRSYISQVRAGMEMGDERCFKIASILKKEPIELLALNRAIRSKDNELKAYWLKIHAEYTEK